MFVAWERVGCLSALWHCNTWGNHPHLFEERNGMWRRMEQSWFGLSNDSCIHIRTKDERASTKRRGSEWVSMPNIDTFIANSRGWLFTLLLASLLIAPACLSRRILGWQAALAYWMAGCCACVEYMCWCLFLVSNTHSWENNRAHMLPINDYKQHLGDCPFASHVMSVCQGRQFAMALLYSRQSIDE